MPTFLVGAVIAGLVEGTTIAAGIGFSLTAFTTAAILGGLATALAKKPGQPDQSLSATSSFAAQGRNLTITQPISPWEIVLGEVRKGGVITFAYRDTAKQYFHLIVTLACHAVDGMEELILNGEVIGPDKLDASGNVISGNWGTFSFPAVNDTGTIPGSPFQVATSQDVYSVQSVSYQVNVDGGEQGGGGVQDIGLTEVSGTPGSGQYSRSGNTFTFPSDVQGAGYNINYTRRETDSKCRVKFATGAETSQPFPDLVAESEGRWTDAHRQTGHAKLYLRFPLSALQGGVPQISAVLRGLKPYDSRVSASPWSFNPALQLAAYLQDTEFGFGADDSDIDTAALEAAANLAEERVLATDGPVIFSADPTTNYLTLTGPASDDGTLDLNAVSGAPVRTPRTGDGVRLTTSAAMLPAPLQLATTYYVIREAAGLIRLASSFANAMARTAIDITNSGSGGAPHYVTLYDEPRYTANGAFLTSQARSDLVDLLRGAMAGRLVHISDTWFIYGGAYQAPTVTLDERELAGPVRITPIAATSDAANGVRGVFVDTANNFTATDFPAVTDDTYVEADGGEAIWADLDFTGLVDSSATAQRLAKIELRRRRFALTFTAPFRLSAWRSVTAATVAMNFAKYGWANGTQEFEVVASNFTLLNGDQGAPALGVELTLRQSASEIWDWDLSEQQVQAAVRNTNLPNPFDVTEPGFPAVTEELYATTGSTGVKSRALLSWAAGDSQPVDHYELRYKLASAADYIQPPSVPGPAVQVDDLTAGMYLFGIRAVTSLGAASDWVTVVKELLGLTAPPADISGFAVQNLGGGQARYTWTKPADLDVRIGGRVIVRWSPKTSSATWEHGSLVDPDGFPGDTSGATFSMPGSGTFMAKARDSSGNFSDTEASFVVTLADLEGLSTLATVTESPSFAGAKTNVAMVDGALQLDTANLIDDILTNVDDWGYIDSQGGLSATGSYAFASKMDLGSVKDARLFASVDSLAFDADDLWDSRTDLIDDWGPVDGNVIEDAETQLMVRVTNDNPAGSPTWGPWHALGLVADYHARGFDFRLDFATASATHNRAVTALSVAAKA